MDIIQKKEINEGDNEILMPVADIAYSIRERKVFSGDVVPIPNVIIEYLDNKELQIFSLIFRHQRKHGSCIMRLRVIAEYMRCTQASIINAVNRLESMGIITKSRMPGNNRRYSKKINFENIQKLDDFIKDKKPGAAAMLREEMGDNDISEIPKNIAKRIEALYSWSDDPAEEEEYTFAKKLKRFDNEAED
jgi:DNA-binding MarR family transcriptional regulator